MLVRSHKSRRLDSSSNTATKNETIIIGNDKKECIPGKIPGSGNKGWLPINAFTRKMSLRTQEDRGLIANQLDAGSNPVGGSKNKGRIN